MSDTRPLKLTMTAFGPYKDREVIDFAELQDHRLFVISGNTGAGKTSIFDAICFALYGAASGEDRSDSSMLRSHFADDQAPTSVDFQFELKGRTYRVFRQLAHVKAGNKGATGDRYELYEIAGGQETPLTDRFIVSQVDEKIREIIGLTREQFSQIVMLPQGEFRKLLTSETENKEAILRRIFKTGLYKYVTDHLNEKRKQMQQVCAGLDKVREHHIGNVQDSLSGREVSVLHRVFQQEHYNTYQVLEALDQEICYYAEEMKEMEQRLQAATDQYRRDTEVFHQARGLNEQFDILEQKRASKQQLEAQAQAMRQAALRLSLAEEAVHLGVYERHDAEMAEEWARKIKWLEDAMAECEQAEASLGEAEAQYRLEEGHGEQREQALRELDRLQGFLPIVKEIDQKQQRVLKLAKEAEALSLRCRDAQGQLESKQAARSAKAVEVRELEGRSLHLPDKTARLNLLRQQATLIKEYLGLGSRLVEEQAIEREHSATFEQADQAYARLEDRWIEGQASFLASHLQEGEACPVCGSLDHPGKATASGDIPAREQLDRLRMEKSAAEKQYLAAQAQRAATEQQLLEKRWQVLEQGFNLDGIQRAFAELVQEGKALAEEEKQLKEAHVRLVSLKGELEALDRELDTLREQRDVVMNSFNDTKSEHAKEQALYDQSLAGLPEDVRSLEQLEQRIREAADHKQRMEAVWKRAQAQYQAANERNIKAAAARDHAISRRNEAAARREKARQSFDEALHRAGFKTEEAYKMAKMTDAERAELKQHMEAYHASVAAVTQQMEELSASLAGKERQDLATLSKQLEAAEQSIETIRGGLAQAEHNHRKGIEGRENIRLAESRWQAAEREHQQVKDLFDVVRGDNSKKISFERYLQIEFLEKIIHNANHRLQRISGGQYYLVRSDRVEKRGKQSGLGFDVYDNYTGLLRDVKTLSGGEKFNASLCLALGMADVIQAYEGGISLETMFIDEGFGSLDEESLNKAIDTLVDLQQSGRMIGVISHVQELKQAIPAILEVRKTSEGYSYTRFHVH